MVKAILVTVLISAIWIQCVVGFKCYHQECHDEDDDEPGYRCYFGADGKGGIEGEVEDDDIGCYEMRHVRNGKLWIYHRNIIQREGYESEKDKIKEGCVSEKDNSAGMDEEWETCYCFKDLCNTKYKTPDGAKLGYGNED